MKSEKKVKLNLKGKTAVYIDWANVHGWKKSVKGKIDPKKLYTYLKDYKNVEDIRFYFGTDKHKKSKEFIKKMRKVGYRVRTKPVKYIKIATVGKTDIHTRKCDFDIEIIMDTYAAIDKNFQSFVYFTGDGDFAPFYKYLIKNKKQVIVVYTAGHIGREIWEIKKGIFKVQLIHLMKL